MSSGVSLLKQDFRRSHRDLGGLRTAAAGARSGTDREEGGVVSKVGKADGRREGYPCVGIRRSTGPSGLCCKGPGTCMSIIIILLAFFEQRSQRWRLIGSCICLVLPSLPRQLDREGEGYGTSSRDEGGSHSGRG